MACSLEFKVADDVTFKMEASVDNVAQTPDAGTVLVTIIDRTDNSVILAETSGSISGTIMYYQVLNLAVGEFRIYFTAKFNSGEDERTGFIDYNVKDRD